MVIRIEKTTKTSGNKLTKSWLTEGTTFKVVNFGFVEIIDESREGKDDYTPSVMPVLISDKGENFYFYCSMLGKDHLDSDGNIHTCDGSFVEYFTAFVQANYGKSDAEILEAFVKKIKAKQKNKIVVTREKFKKLVEWSKTPKPASVVKLNFE